MASLLFTIGGAVVNALAFSGTNFDFSKLTDHGEEERKKHDLAEEQLQKARDQWNEDRIKQLYFVNKRLREKNEARAYINNADEAMLEYYRVIVKKIKPLPPEPQLSDFYHPSEAKKNGELLFVTVGAGIATYALYKYLKKMTEKEKLYRAYYQPDSPWTGNKAIKELHKITSISKKDNKSWLTKQTLWQVHIPAPKEINHPHYNMRETNEQHQSDILYMPRNVFKGNTHTYILIVIDVASRYKVTRPLRTKKSNEVAFLLESIYKKGGVFKYPKVFQCDNGSEFKSEVTKLLEKYNVDIRRATAKYKHTHRALLDNFNKELAKLLFKPMDAQDLQEPEKVFTIWVKNLNKIVNKMNVTVTSMIGIKPKDTIKLDTVPLDKKISRRNRTTRRWTV